ncbi:Phorbol-ester/DAG-type domain-containing protein [Heracleum sosnowskyi]|uniref:Phorbol-ester/DAG-type domain-containing protein n=1 Tax=Heracleum sosnowskyi TaxID=360622 RepID=A0AAD8H394_9APIA|nr:Phorbol-ester/DAG-type domain-containing protein [Heracleum sosnowskyi]
MKHLAHQHLLVLNENYIAKEGDVCTGCREQIDSCKSFVYSCSNFTSSTTTSTSGVENLCVQFLLHKTCAELPPKIVNPIDPNEFLFFKPLTESPFTCCVLCGLPRNWFTYRSRISNKVCVCIKCAVFQVQQSTEDPIIVHPAHNHPLALIEYPSSFKCRACKVNDHILDLSYRCTKCQFWMHKSCGDAPVSFLFHFHKHPLILAFSLPEVYRKFDQYCRICNERLLWLEWLYCCLNCRFFAHFQCARSIPSPVSSSSSENETYRNLVHLPAADELSLNLLLEQFVKDKITLSDSSNNSSIFSATNYIKHWAHEEHDLKLITINELYDRKNDDEILLLCDGCVEPIRTYEGQSCYGCVPCNFFMHKGCAELPREIENHLWPGKTLYANKYNEPFKVFYCDGCGVNGNGIFFGDRVTPSDKGSIHLHIGCVTLHKVIKHEAHLHQLDQVFRGYYKCNACGQSYRQHKHGCKKCDFYLCGGCIMKARTYKHRWDPHPLDLIYDVSMVAEHEHDFDCEYCSEDINPNYWFYHCSRCDLSLHTLCMEKSSYREFKYVKFGATDIIRDKLHPHGLTFVLNKKVRSCVKCGRDNQGEPVLQCAPCNTIFCMWCVNK